jgi:hypothetical protein
MTELMIYFNNENKIDRIETIIGEHDGYVNGYEDTYILANFSSENEAENAYNHLFNAGFDS